MRTSFFLFLLVVTFATSSLDFVSAENAAIQNSAPQFRHGDSTARHLRATYQTTEEDKESMFIQEEERAGAVASMVSRLKALVSRSPKNGKIDAKSANEALTKVNSIMGPGKTSTKLTPDKVKALETYARDNPDKWYAMAYYVNYVFGIGLVAFLMYGTFYLGWRPLGVGGPRPN